MKGSLGLGNVGKLIRTVLAVDNTIAGKSDRGTNCPDPTKRADAVRRGDRKTALRCPEPISRAEIENLSRLETTTAPDPAKLA